MENQTTRELEVYAKAFKAIGNGVQLAADFTKLKKEQMQLLILCVVLVLAAVIAANSFKAS